MIKKYIPKTNTRIKKDTGGLPKPVAPDINSEKRVKPSGANKLIKVRRATMIEREIEINTEYIKLDSAMKLSDLVNSGGEAKNLIEGGNVCVNGETCLSRGKKLREGDSFTFMRYNITVKSKKDENDG